MTKLYPWNILKIERTKNVKVIKKAYASLVKIYKPDEYPDKFNEIKLAYNEAVKRAKKITLRNQKLKNDADNNPSQEVHSTPKQGPTKNESKIAKEIVNSVNSLIKKEVLERSDVRNWRFILKYEEIIDLTLRENVSEKVFSMVSSVCHLFYNQQCRVYLPGGVLEYLSRVFSWEEKWRAYEKSFPENSAIVFIYKLDKNLVQRYVICDFESRAANIFSTFFLSSLLGVIVFYLKGLSVLEAAQLSFAIAMSFKLFYELLNNHCFISDVPKVFASNSQGTRLPLRKTILRHVIINLTLLPIYVSLYKINIGFMYWGPVFSTIFFAHIIHWIRFKQLIHDGLTSTVSLLQVGKFDEWKY